MQNVIQRNLTLQQYDQKNIRRRVYDALNVLMAMNIISKEKKEIRWLGLPTNSIQECSSLEKEKQTKVEQIQKKTQQLQELILQVQFANCIVVLKYLKIFLKLKRRLVIYTNHIREYNLFASKFY